LCVLEANGGTCTYCTRRSEVMDHVVPFAQGGADDLSNLVPACERCNGSKGNRTPLEWWLSMFMRDHWDGNGTVHGGVRWNKKMTLRDLYLNRHEEALAVLENVEEVLAEIADKQRQRWFVRATPVDYPSPFMTVGYYRALYAKTIEMGRKGAWGHSKPEEVRKQEKAHPHPEGGPDSLSHSA